VDNVQGIQESALVVFGGLVAEVEPSSIPAGSSPLCCDIDFTVTSARTRDGLANVYSFEGNFDLGVASIGASVAAGPNEQAWVNPESIATNTPGTYASVVVNQPVSAIDGIGEFDQWASQSGDNADIATGDITPTQTNEIAFFFTAYNYYNSVTPASGWSTFGHQPPSGFSNGDAFYQILTSESPIGATATLGSGADWCAALLSFGLVGNSAPTIIQQEGRNGGFSGGQTATFSNPTMKGSTIVVVQVIGHLSSGGVGPSLIDGQGNFYEHPVSTVSGSGGVELDVWYTQNVPGGSIGNFTISGSGNGTNWGFVAYEIAPGTPSSPPQPKSELLEATAFGLTVPSIAELTGLEVIVNGKQSSLAPGAVLTIVPIGAPTSFVPRSFQLPLGDGSFTLGSPTDQWGEYWTPSEVNNPAFGFSIQTQDTGGAGATFDISGVEVRAWYSRLDVVPAIPPGDGIGALDQAADGQGTGTAITTPSVTPTASQEVAFFFTGYGLGNSVTPASGWSNFGNQPPSGLGVGNAFYQLLSSESPIAGAATGANVPWASAIVTFLMFGNSDPIIVQQEAQNGGFSGYEIDTTPTFGTGLAGGAVTQIGVSYSKQIGFLPTTKGNTILVVQVIGELFKSGGDVDPSLSDAQGNVYDRIVHVVNGLVELDVWVCQDIPGGDLSPFNVNGIAGGNEWGFTAYELTAGTAGSHEEITPHDFTYVKTFRQTDGEVLTLALDNSGIFWQENVNYNPDVLVPFYTAIEPNTFAVSTTEDDREFIALSDLLNATDMPRQYNGQWVDRISQLGPAAPPSVNATSNTYDVVSITQAPASGDPGNPGHFQDVLWSAGPGSNVAGNVLTVYYQRNPPYTIPDPLLVIGGCIYLTDIPNIGGVDPNGTYVITSVGEGIPPGGAYERWYFTVNMLSTQYANLGASPSPPTGQYELTLATLTVSTPVPNLQVGSQITLSGVTPGGWDGTFTITATPNAAQLNITSTSLSGGVATYDYTLITGTAPIVGQQVTVTNTNNGDGIFNVVNAVISSISAGQFSVNIASPNIPAAPETGSGIINGTIFEFDPGSGYVGTSNSPIFGPGSGGTVVVPGNLGAGIRGVVQMFLTRNGYLTAPSPEAIFTLTEGANSLIVSNLAIGPPNVIARVIAFTGAGGATQVGGGGFYFWIPAPVTVIDNGQKVTYTATIVNDNTTSQVTLSFTDAVLLAGLSISNEGTNNFAQIELGSSTGVIAYAQRLFAWGEQNKLQNLLNFSFDGGYLAGSTVPTPLGWTVDPTNGAGGSITTSPIFGNAFYIQNTSGTTQALYGMITQDAYEDANAVPIVPSATALSIRVTASCPSQVKSGELTVDLYSPSLSRVWGSFSVPMAVMASSMTIYEGTLLTTPFTIVPKDLVIRVYAQNILNGGDVMIDRIEPYPTDSPIFSTQLRASYFNNFEAFDQVTGNLGVAQQNQQPVTNAFELFDNLYVVKSGSFVSTRDNGTTEPDFWTISEVSNKVGTPSIHGVDVGEGWALIAGQAGLYLFTGGDPTKISPEIDPVWQTINWKYGQTLWLRNDTVNRKILIGVPIPTPNQWMPGFPVNANPTEPNVVLVCNYKELMSAGALASEGPVRLTYTGELKSFPLGRKWSAWSIEACYADFITRPDTTAPVFFCGDTGTGKIYQQLAGNYADDGNAMHSQYITYPFPKTAEAQQMQMGLHQLLAHFLSMLVIGEGNLRVTIYPDTITSPDQEALFPEPLLNPPPYGDMELPVNLEGNRFFVGLEVVDPGEWFEISRAVMALGKNPWAELRGRNQ
jgi:hypothetical protein